MVKKIIVLVLLFVDALLFSQPTLRTQQYLHEPKGNFKHRKAGVMDGNRIRTLYYNDGQIGDWPVDPSCEWPKGTGHRYLDGVALLVGANVTANGKTFKTVETAYREEVDISSADGSRWGMEAVPGYSNSIKNYPAKNVDSTSFPDHWPRSLFFRTDSVTNAEVPMTETDAAKWDGYWYGYFGRGVTNADFETFYVIDDAQDKEFTRAPFNYYPVSSDSTRGGMGLRVEVRGFQWSHVLAEDILFWHYDIVNISDHDYNQTAFGFFTDPGVGDENQVNNSAFFTRDEQLNLCYTWCYLGVGEPGKWKTGYYGYAYLESPGNALNSYDDDGDATKTGGAIWRNGSSFNAKMVDERRDDNIDNDEDWDGYTDLNNNGKWDVDEPLNDDLGSDGVSPFDVQYRGADEGEGDGKPTHGEPNFDETDKDESDQIGLTAVSIQPLSNVNVWPKHDDAMWGKMTGGFLDTSTQNTNIKIVFASGPFKLQKNRRERFSMALVFGDNLNIVIFNKKTVQAIYDANYNFSQPPYTPHLEAVPADRKVHLYWDNNAEQSYDRFLQKNDFEGYSIYRATDPEFNDAKLITNSFGDPVYWKPLARYDMVDSITGPDPIGINGAHFYRGSDTGLRHSYIDSTVKNGMRYYYAVVSYDQGLVPNSAKNETGLQPTECPKVISVDFAGTLKFIDINCAVVTPNAQAAGYVPPHVQGVLHHANGVGTGSLSVNVLDPARIKDGDEYKVVFNSKVAAPAYKTESYGVYKFPSDTIFAHIDIHSASPAFSGMMVTVTNDSVISLDADSTGWLFGNSSIVMNVGPDYAFVPIGKSAVLPNDYELQYFDTVVDTTLFIDPSEIPNYPQLQLKFKILNRTTGKYVKCIVYHTDTAKTIVLGDSIKIIEGDIASGNFTVVWNVSYGMPVDSVVAHPKNGDKYFIRTRKPFKSGDYFTFTTHAQYIDRTLAKYSLSNITVVPNPYITNAEWEQKTLFQSGRGTRKISFNHLPAQCTVRIYTMTGILIKTLHKNSTINDGSLSWDLITEDGMDVAYGLYIFHVDAPGMGEHIGRFALIK
ncbi:MAG: hypothetical protein WCX28_09255 [Bacteriovoracaceae bacterium]|nr:hypothetical protein [Bacteroidota bacterium]